MGLSNNELLMLDSLAYYPELSDNIYRKLEAFIGDLNSGLYKTVFDKLPIYDDKDLGMDKIIDLVNDSDILKRLIKVYPQNSLTTTSSVCLVDPDPEKLDVYVIYVGNYADSPYKYESKEISTWGN
ncbi:MAG: hypothetical protein IJA34_14445, partial [Lachnospiraceae bacterium]|nr:hypothetical protein [Lachnospiraceae bacterium]